MNFILHRNRTLASKMGHSIEFKKGVPTHVPPECHEEALGMGAVPESELEDADQKDVPLTDEEKSEKLVAAIEAMVGRNQRDDFTAAGLPHSKALAGIVGFPVDASQRDAAWAKFQAKEAE